ncbi:MAG: hypothetical protein ABGX04_00310 [Myxococcales bacterium]|jgi:hypothetical protein
MNYLLAAYALTVGTLVVYGITLARESSRLRKKRPQPDLDD